VDAVVQRGCRPVSETQLFRLGVKAPPPGRLRSVCLPERRLASSDEERRSDGNNRDRKPRHNTLAIVRKYNAGQDHHFVSSGDVRVLISEVNTKTITMLSG